MPCSLHERPCVEFTIFEVQNALIYHYYYKHMNGVQLPGNMVVEWTESVVYYGIEIRLSPLAI